ncbi:hypothetical protein Ddc_20138 [Ditylenchus destructor]|nr:hypothetical protein Ddc_20138 [Ditylenchus destructor]
MCSIMQSEGLKLNVRYSLFDNERGAWRSFLEEQLRYPELILPKQAVQSQQAQIEPPEPAIRARMCLFHSSQAIFRKVQDLGYHVEYQHNAELEIFVKMMCAVTSNKLYGQSALTFSRSEVRTQIGFMLFTFFVI